MSRAADHVLAEATAVTPDMVRGSTTRARKAGAPSTGPRATALMFGDVSPLTRMQMVLVAKASASPATALAPVIDLLVADGSARKRAAIVDAISTNLPLREQWERTWEILRS